MCVFCGLCNFKIVYWIGLYRLEIGLFSSGHLHVGEPENLVASQSKKLQASEQGELMLSPFLIQQTCLCESQGKISSESGV